MRIWPRRLARRAAFFAAASCTVADYDRKPRGGPQWERRYQLLLRQEKIAGDGILRRRCVSWGGRVYAGLVVVLVSAMIHGLKPERVRRMREALRIDRAR